MAKKGEVAREQVKNIIQTAFNENYMGVKDKKIYIKGSENGEEIQFALTITMPKSIVTDFDSEDSIPKTRISPQDNQPFDWSSDDEEDITVNEKISIELPEEEQKRVSELMAKLGIVE